MAKFTLTIDTDNAAFEDADRNTELARILRKTAKALEDYPNFLAGNVRDLNGNTVGRWELKKDDENKGDEPDGYYWCLMSKGDREVDVVLKSGDLTWSAGSDEFVKLNEVTLVQRIEPPPGYYVKPD